MYTHILAFGRKEGQNVLLLVGAAWESDREYGENPEYQNPESRIRLSESDYYHYHYTAPQRYPLWPKGRKGTLLFWWRNLLSLIAPTLPTFWL